MYLVIWEYQVKPGRQQDFEKIYSTNGLWAKLFKRGAGYLNTELLRDPDRPRRYITIDHWISLEAYEAFLAKWKEDYDALDAHCKDLTERESQLGTFTPF
ncbi:MAG: antibiotic biosynthesis monooxygenase [Chloroflexi bacterium]|nr:antibiotic biosynthesis monooxygenase [Chloroflexota bacterium]